MIKNQREYRITKAQAAKFEKALASMPRRRAKSATHPLLQKAQVESLRSQLADLQTELKQFEQLQSGRRKALPLDSLSELPQALIRARIAAGFSQKTLAERLGLKEQQIQRYEATNYAAASLRRIQQIAKALDPNVQADATVA